MLPLWTVNLTLISKNHEATNVNLKPVNTFLANKNIPIWIARGMLLGRINSTKVYKLKILTLIKSQSLF